MTYKTDTADLIKTIITRLKTPNIDSVDGYIEILISLANNLDHANMIQKF